MRRKNSALITLVLLIGLAAVPVDRISRQLRQERLDYALIGAVARHKATAVQQLLRQGANPNTPILPDDKRSAWRRLLDRLLDRPGSLSFDTDSLLLKTVGWQQEQGTVSLAVPSFDNAEMTRMLVESGANVNFHGTGDQYESAMSDLGIHEAYQAADGRWHTTPLLTAAGFQQWNVVKILLAHHGDVNAVDTFGNTPLMYAAGFDNADAVETILECGADVNARNHSGETALLYALDAYRIMSDFHTIPELRATVACLLRHGASVDIRDSSGTSVLTMALFFGQKDEMLLQMLKKAGARE